MGIINLLASRNFIAVNRVLAKELGLLESVMIGELASECEYWTNKGEINSDGYFYSTVENIEKMTTLSDYTQRKIIQSLKERGVINCIITGVPPKRFIKINEESILKIFENQRFSFSRIESEKNEELNLEKIKTNNNKENNNNNNNNNNITVVTAKRFTPPTVEEVEAYCTEKGYGVNAQRFVDFYESKGWMIGKNKMTKWKSAVATWEHKDREQGKVGINGIRLKPDTGEPDILDGIL